MTNVYLLKVIGHYGTYTTGLYSSLEKAKQAATNHIMKHRGEQTLNLYEWRNESWSLYVSDKYKEYRYAPSDIFKITKWEIDAENQEGVVNGGLK